jgi:RNA polymerase sigma-70 factor (ECF subfamily)
LGAVTPEFGALYRAEVGYVLNSLRRLGVHERDLEDLAHDVFFAAYRHLADYDPSRALRPWLFGFAYRMASDYRQLSRHRHERALGDDVDNEDPKGRPDEELELARKRRLVLRALERLDLDRRAVLVMHDLDGHTMPEIAAELGLPLNTAYSRLRLARRDFAALLDTLGPRPSTRSST